MKLILEPTTDQSTRGVEATHPRVEIEIPDDDMTINQYVDCLIRPALMAKGFSEQIVTELFDPDPSEEAKTLRGQLNVANELTQTILRARLDDARRLAESEHNLAASRAKRTKLELENAQLSQAWRESIQELTRLGCLLHELKNQKPAKKGWRLFS